MKHLTQLVLHIIFSAFYLIFVRDVYITTLANALQTKLRYLGDDFLLSVEMLRETCMLGAINVKWARDRQPSKKTKDLPKSKVGDLMLLKNHTKIGMLSTCPTFALARYSMTEHMFYKTQLVMLEVLLMPAEYIVSVLLDVKAFGHTCKYIMMPLLCQI